MFRLEVLRPEDLEIIPYTANGLNALRIVHKPTLLQVSDESGADYHRTRDKLLKELDGRVVERDRQRDCG